MIDRPAARRFRGPAAGVVLATLWLGIGARARGERGLGLVLELTAGPGWRSAIGGDGRAPGFHVATGGGDLTLGLEAGSGFAVLAGARVRGGAAGELSYLEAAGDLAAQARIGERVRARVGIDAGRAWLRGVAAAPLVSGFVAVSFDLWIFSAGRVAVALAVRLDVGGFIAPAGDPAADHFPGAVIALSTGLGFRY